MGGSASCLRCWSQSSVAPLSLSSTPRLKDMSQQHRAQSPPPSRSGHDDSGGAVVESSSPYFALPKSTSMTAGPSSRESPPYSTPGAPSTSSLPPVLQRHLLKQAVFKRLKLVKRTMFGQCLDTAELTALSQLFSVSTVEAGAVVFHQGAVADVFYIVWRGSVNVKFSDKESLISTEGNTAAADAAGRRTVITTKLSPEEEHRTLNPAKTEKRRANSMQVDSAKSDLAAVDEDKVVAAAPPLHSSGGPRSPRASPPAPSAAASQSRFFSYPSRETKDKPAASPTSPTAPAVALPGSPAHLRGTSESPTRDAARSSSFALLTTKSAGDWLGLEALRLGRQYRTCACIANTPCTLLSLSSSAFQTFAASLGKDKRRKLADLVGDSIQACLQKMPYLAGVSPAKVSLLSSLFVWTMLRAGQVLFEEGERDKKGNGLYFLYEGTVGVWCKDESGQSRLLKDLTAGVCFGELGLIIHLPRTATIRAHCDCLLLHLPHRSFHNFLHLTPEILTHFREQIETYQLNVLYLLENELISQYFFQHCAREYSTENLEFWWEAKDFRLRDMDEEERKREAERIIELYITDSSPKQINLKGHTQKNILSVLRKPSVGAAPTPHSGSSDSRSPPLSPSSDWAPMSGSSSPSSPRASAPRSLDSELFVEAENEIFNLLATDSFSRFKASPLFRECLEEMHMRVRSSSISMGSAFNTGLGSRAGQTPSSSGLSATEPSPSGSPKSVTDDARIKLAGSASGVNDTVGAAQDGKGRAEKALDGRRTRSAESDHATRTSDSFKRSNTGLGAAHGVSAAARGAPLRRTNTASRTTANTAQVGPAEYLNSRKAGQVEGSRTAFPSSAASSRHEVPNVCLAVTVDDASRPPSARDSAKHFGLQAQLLAKAATNSEPDLSDPLSDSPEQPIRTIPNATAS